MDWQRWWERITAWFEKYDTLWAWLGGVSVLTFFLTLTAALLVLIMLPPNYLKQRSRFSQDWPFLLRIPYLVIKNIFGILFILAGLAMLLLPGQGLLTLIIGLALVNLPGKRRLIRRILQHRKILPFINRLRARARRPPLEAPGGVG